MTKYLKRRITASAFLLMVLHFTATAQKSRSFWIGPGAEKNEPNTWLAYKKTVNISNKRGSTIARIAADSKYWLWINGKLVVFEGGLKRGPNPADTYADEFDLAPHLKTGKNTIAVLVWFFGKDGFSHKNSGTAGLFFDCPAAGIFSDRHWKCLKLEAYQTAGPPLPNYRLPESSILYDAAKSIGFWQGADFDDTKLPDAVELASPGAGPWGQLLKRPTPLFKDFGLKHYAKSPEFPFISKGDTIVCDLPYNAQFTPYFKIDGDAGKKITMYTDNYLLFLGGENVIRAEYLSKKGVQEYENPGWTNGHKMYYIVPKGIKVLDLQFRESGYATEFAGSFNSSDPFFNKLWKKAQRTLYLNMRDGYMDCPERERAQWTGDAVNESGQAFYALSLTSQALSRKWLHELISWQKKDSSLFSPSPAGNWDKELPDQSMASVGYYGLWNYYQNTGDKQTLVDLYDGAKRYVEAWKLNEKGTIIFRPGGWTWGDWGENRDMLLLYNLWYYLGIKGLRSTAAEIGKTADAEHYEQQMNQFKAAFNAQFWNGSAYRDPQYKGQTDDRTQALAVLSGIAVPEKYPALLQILQTEEHASPYMEKYVFEAMFFMGYEEEALARHKKRFGPMVMNDGFSTLFEVWNVNADGTGGGTVNHAWSGGGLTILSQYLSGVSPSKPGYKQFWVKPQPGSISSFQTVVPSVAGKINVSWTNKTEEATLKITVPGTSEAIAFLPKGNYEKILLNGKVVWSKSNSDSAKQVFKLKNGDWTLKGIKVRN
jgi:alpha-L-rhamnosidase